MAPQDIIKRLKREPFEPFQIVKEDGERWPVQRRNHAHIVPRNVIYLFRQAENEEEGIMDGPLILSMDKIKAIEPISANAID